LICPKGVCPSWTWVQPDDSSDVGPDGVDDMLVNMAIGQSVIEADSGARILDGRTGRLAWETDAALFAPAVAIDGRGDDFTSLEVAGNTMTLEAVDGRGRKLWGGLLTGPRRVLPRQTDHLSFGLRLDRDRCADVLAEVFLDEDTFYALIDGGSGRVLWSRWSGRPSEHPSFSANRDLNRAC
jgi:hypothetical protein